MKSSKTPFLTTAFTQSGKRAKNRLENILIRKTFRLWLSVAALGLASALCMCTLVSCNEKSSLTEQTLTDDATKKGMTIDEAVGTAILRDNENRYAECEFYCEGHIILGKDKKGDETKVYTVASYGGYSFMNGMFVKDSGSGAVPVLITLGDTEGGYEIRGTEYPKDGSHYTESVKEMFPPLIATAALVGEFYPSLERQERSKAKAYLKLIDRNAKVGAYSDLNVVLPNMSAEASNKLISMEKYKILWSYPMYIGNYERLEDSERYIYETEWDGDESGGIITYTKYDSSGRRVE